MEAADPAGGTVESCAVVLHITLSAAKATGSRAPRLPMRRDTQNVESPQAVPGVIQVRHPSQETGELRLPGRLGFG